MNISDDRAQAALAAARAAAAQLAVPMNVAVIDAGAHLKAFVRMDGALLGSIDIALGKARTSALFGMNTETVGEFCKPGGSSPGLELTNGTLVVFGGGVPIRNANGAVIGAIGVSGGAVDQDRQVANAAAAAAESVALGNSAGIPASGERAMQEDANRALVQRGFDAWRDGTGSPYELLAEDANWEIMGNSIASKSYPSREAFLAEVIRPFNARMRDRLIPSVRRLYCEGDTVVALFDAKGTARDGTSYANSYAWFLQMKGGKIVRAQAFFDSILFDDFWRRVTPG